MAIAMCWMIAFLWLWVCRESRSATSSANKFCRRPKPVDAVCKDKRFHPMPPNKRSGGRPKAQWVVEWALARFATGLSFRQVADEFNRQYVRDGLYMCHNSVKNWVQTYSAEALEIRRATRNRFPKPTTANLRWCLDGTGKADSSGAQHFILGIMDYGRRVCVKLVALADGGSATTILVELFDAIEKFGRPAIIKTDNASVFHSVEFEDALAAHGIRHEFIGPGKPWQNRIERLFWTLKEKLNQVEPTDRVALNSLLGDFCFWYNEVRPHQHLHGWTPAEAWCGINPYETTPRAVIPFAAWGGLLQGVYLHRYPIRR